MIWLGLLALLLLGVQAIRSAVVAALGESRPDLARQLWPSHPVPRITSALIDIAATAKTGGAAPEGALRQIEEAGRLDPLGVSPMLVAATQRLAAGDLKSGERLLEAALQRDPRSTAAHFLLADLYLRQQRVGDALIHVGVFARRSRGVGIEPLAAALATYLRDSGKVAEVRPVLEEYVPLRQAVMAALAQDPAATLALRRLSRPGDEGAKWLGSAFERQLAAGRVGEARSLLAAVGIEGSGAELTRWGGSAGPLSWQFPASSDGVVEPVSGGPLRIISYGRADVMLAEHLLLLPPGRIRFAAQWAGQVPPAAFEWRLTCLAGARELATWPVPAPTSVQTADIPADCPAQRVALWGRMGEFPRTASAELLRASLASTGEVR